MNDDMQKLREYHQFEVAHALASAYTAEQLTQALEIRRQRTVGQPAIDPFDTPLQSEEVCESCTGACVTSTGTATCDSGDDDAP